VIAPFDLTVHWQNIFTKVMKWKLLLCAAGLAVAGCASDNNNNNTDAYATYGEFGFSYDLVPSPVPGLTAADVQQMYGTTTITPAVYGQNLPIYVTPVPVFTPPNPVVPGGSQAPVVAPNATETK
jgi:hypothetical protein